MSILTPVQFQALVNTLRPGLLRYAIRAVGWDHAEDVVQTCLAAAWYEAYPESAFRAPHFRETGTLFIGSAVTFVPFLRKHLRNALDAFYSDPARRHEIAFSPSDLLSLAERDQRPDVSSQLWDALREELASLLTHVSLTPRQEVCVRLWLDGMTQAEVGAFLGISRPAVSAHIAAVVVKCRDALQELTEVDAEVLAVFAACCDQTVYHKPTDVWEPWRDKHPPERRRVPKPKLPDDFDPREKVDPDPVYVQPGRKSGRRAA